MKSKFLEPIAIQVASGCTIKAAAVVAGCSEQTAYNLSSTPEFRQRVSEIRTESVVQAVSILTSNATRASNALVKLLDSKDEKIVLAATTKLLSMLQPLSELAELRARIDSIENRTQLKVAQ